jgi:hypothetical protein
MEIKVSIGEIVDKYTILKLKIQLIPDKDKLKNVAKECEYLRGMIDFLDLTDEPMLNELFHINKDLWMVEDDLRECEKLRKFDQNFIELARKVYRLNDLRAFVKKQINFKYNSDFVEEKSYEEY